MILQVSNWAAAVETFALSAAIEHSHLFRINGSKPVIFHANGRMACYISTSYDYHVKIWVDAIDEVVLIQSHLACRFGLQRGDLVLRLFQISMFRQSFLSEHSKHKAASPLRINVAMETHHFSEEHHLPIGMIAESCEIMWDIYGYYLISQLYIYI